MIVNPISGKMTSEETASKILNSYTEGERRYHEFVTDRLVLCKTSFYSRVPSSNISFKAGVMVNMNREKAAKNPKPGNSKLGIIAQVIAAATSRSEDTSGIMAEYDVDEHPLCIATEEGHLYESKKCYLKNALMNTTDVECQNFDEFIQSDCVAEKSAYVIDAMALLHKVRPAGRCSFGDYAQILLNNITYNMRRHKCIRGEVLFDDYSRDISVKSMQRDKRAKGKPSIRVRIESATIVPAAWTDFLCDRENKNAVTSYLRKEWLKSIQEVLRTDEIMVLSLNGAATMVSKAGVAAMPHHTNNHEEADTLMIFHVANLLNTYNRFVVSFDDTDILVLLAHFYNKWRLENVEVWMASKGDYLPIHRLSGSLGTKSDGLLALHAITGCDTVSYIYGLGKATALKIYMENEFSCLEDLGSGQVGEVAAYSDLFYHFYGQGGYEGTMANSATN